MSSAAIRTAKKLMSSQEIVPTKHSDRKMASVMFADLVGFSTRLEEDEIQNSIHSTRSINLFCALVVDYGGRVASVAGDGILAEFDAPDQAANFAIRATREFRDQAVWSDGNPIKFRIALNRGEVMHDNGNVLGHCVNVAARIQALANPGTVVVAEAFYTALQDPTKFTFRSIGKPALKNIAEPVEVFVLDEADFAPVLAAPPIQGPAVAAPAHSPSVVVIPLNNQSGDPANDHLCEGLSEDVIANLSRFRNLVVIARHSAFQFARKIYSPQEIGRQLGVRYLLGGSLRQNASSLRIAVELLDTTTNAALWNDRFDINIADFHDIHEEISAAVAFRLAVQIDLDQERHESRAPIDMRAYGMCLRGQQLLQGFTKEGNAHARQLFKAAVDLAPDYGRAYSGISRTHNYDWRYSWSPSADVSLELAVEFAQSAIQYNRQEARGYAELGFAKLYQKRHNESLAEYGRALSLNPNDADIMAEFADALVYCGQADRSIKMLEKAMRLNPLYPDWYLWYLADAYNAMGRSQEVIRTIQQMQNPGEGRRLLAANYALIGDLDNAQNEAAQVMRVHPEFTIGSWRTRPPYRDQNLLERYIRGLRLAGLPE